MEMKALDFLKRVPTGPFSNQRRHRMGTRQFRYPVAKKKPVITPQRWPMKLTPGTSTDIKMRYTTAYHLRGTFTIPKIGMVSNSLS